MKKHILVFHYWHIIIGIKHISINYQLLFEAVIHPVILYIKDIESTKENYLIAAVNKDNIKKRSFPFNDFTK